METFFSAYQSREFTAQVAAQRTDRYHVEAQKRLEAEKNKQNQENMLYTARRIQDGIENGDFSCTHYHYYGGFTSRNIRRLKKELGYTIENIGYRRGGPICRIRWDDDSLSKNNQISKE